jgi:hypothetical protein
MFRFLIYAYPETSFILRFKALMYQCSYMNKRLTSKKFLEYVEAMYEEGPPVKYPSPDAWVRAIPVNF